MFFFVIRVISFCGLSSDFETVHYLGRSRVNDERFVLGKFLEVVLTPFSIFRYDLLEHFFLCNVNVKNISWSQKLTQGSQRRGPIPWPKLVTTGRHLIRKHIVILLVSDSESAIPNIIAGGCEVPFWWPRPFRFSMSLFFSLPCLS